MDSAAIVSSRVGKPGYLDEPWGRCLPKGLVERMTLNWGPGELCKANLALFIVFVVLLLVTVLLVPQSAPFGWSVWRIVGATVWLLSLFFCICVFSMHKQFGPPRANLFRVNYYILCMPV